MSGIENRAMDGVQNEAEEARVDGEGTYQGEGTYHGDAGAGSSTRSLSLSVNGQNTTLHYPIGKYDILQIKIWIFWKLYLNFSCISVS